MSMKYIILRSGQERTKTALGTFSLGAGSSAWLRSKHKLTFYKHCENSFQCLKYECRVGDWHRNHKQQESTVLTVTVLNIVIYYMNDGTHLWKKIRNPVPYKFDKVVYKYE